MQSELIAISAKFNASPTETEALSSVFEFLRQFPEQLSWQGKNKPNTCTTEGIEAVAIKFYKGRRELRLSHPSTTADPAVGMVLTSAYDFEAKALDEIIKTHQYAMLAENTVGNFLERYVASKIERLGWCWCSGDIIKATDFIKKTTDGWQLLQIKNRNNSENSSSSAIRNNTTIEKWYRSVAQSGTTRWDKFPELADDLSLNEGDFLAFIKDTISAFRSQS